MAGLALRMAFEPLRSLAFGSIGAAYMGVGTPIQHPARQFLVQNLTDASLLFSFDGVNDHFRLPANGFWLNDNTANRSVSQGFFLDEGTRLYVKQDGVPTSGTVDFTIIYGSEA